MTQAALSCVYATALLHVSQRQQEKQSLHNEKLWRVQVTIVAVEKQYYIFPCFV